MPSFFSYQFTIFEALYFFLQKITSSYIFDSRLGIDFKLKNDFEILCTICHVYVFVLKEATSEKNNETDCEHSKKNSSPFHNPLLYLY